ncbi:zinc-finger domain of monoamine-oxidase A repressor R1 [Artemisia annua]|uniref:Zinc-finger domain of monoamine-oxidase A repressor R1 n=1 Tax=Artemisia annua TaxID=35608 RepID=A0A2U1QII8_ARTAN|nr:zinc-finger domain of monoamine-oxidase A repressor R1 [Artemisia annua]
MTVGTSSINQRNERRKVSYSNFYANSSGYNLVEPILSGRREDSFQLGFLFVMLRQRGWFRCLMETEDEPTLKGLKKRLMAKATQQKKLMAKVRKKRGLIPTRVLVRNVKAEGLVSETEDEPTLKGLKKRLMAKATQQKKLMAKVRKKRGLIPTRVLVRNVKAEGLVSETEDEPTLKRIKEEANGESDTTKEVDGKSEEEKNITEEDDVAIQLPQGTELTNLAGIDMPSGDIGNALQLLEVLIVLLKRRYPL